MKAFCIPLRSFGCPSPSTLVTCAPLATVLSGVTHDLLVTPSTMTVQAPHRPTPQPNFTPPVPTWLRRTYNNGSVLSATVTVVDTPFTKKLRVNAVAISARPPFVQSAEGTPESALFSERVCERNHLWLYRG